ncbi:MAG: proton-conducting transporter membrane subunit [Nanoarchaeota archaeon]
MIFEAGTIYSFYAILLLLASAFITAIVGIKKDNLVPFISIASTFAAFLLTVFTVPLVISQKILTMQMQAWPAPFGITVVVDPLALIMALLVTGIGFFVSLFSFRYIEEGKTEYYTLLSLILVGILGVIHTGDMFNLFVFFEIVSISSYALVAFKRNKASFEASIKYLIMNSFATSLILLGIAFLYGMTGTLNMAHLAVEITGLSTPLLPITFGIILAGFALKAGLVPFHTWLPDAHSAAPSPISALMSGIMISMGVYAIIRLTFTVFFAPAAVLSMLVILGIASMLIGAVLAIMQSDLKRMLAYSTVSQIGYISMSLGLGTYLGAVGGIFHIINHTIIKSLLFLCAGVIIYKIKTSDMNKITSKFHPLLGYSFLIGVLSLAGIPLLNGFASKWVIYLATLEVFPILTIFTVMVSVLTLAYGLKAFYLIFLVNVNHDKEKKSIPISMMIPIIILTALCIFFGIFSQFGYEISEFVVSSLIKSQYILGVLNV